ncbi:MAG: hypothetical protein ACOYJ2_00365 [Rickettsiales bacterium]
MNLFSEIAAIFKSIFTKKRDDEWAARFTNPPTRRDGKLPLMPGESELS